MQADQLKQRLDSIEDCVDDAKDVVARTSAPSELRQCVDTLHQQARQLQQACSSPQQQQMGQDVKQQVEQLEQAGDRAMQACRQAGNSVDPETQQAVRKAHDEISSLKKQMQMG